jgi:hypothetical protein
MRKHHKITLAVLALLATLPFFVQADRPEPPVQQAHTEPQAAAPTETPLPAALPVRPEMPEFRGDAFSPESGKPRSAGRGAPGAAARPAAAPANPYRFAGEVRQPGATHRFLVRGNDILEVKLGDLLDDGYRVDAVDDLRVVLVHPASGHRHAIALGEPAAASAPMLAAPVPAEAAPTALVTAPPATMATAPGGAGTTPGAPALLIGGSAAGVPPKALRKS